MNINDYIAQRVIEYLKQRDEHVITLETELRKAVNMLKDNHLNTKFNTAICSKCDKLIFSREKRVECGCSHCSYILCCDCSSDVKKYYYQMAGGAKCDTYYCECDSCEGHLGEQYTQESYLVK